jgi:hypothetical protein
MRRSALNLRTNRGDCFMSDEASPAGVGAERQEILSWTAVVESFEVFRLASEHVLAMARRDPLGPPEGERHGCQSG